MRFSVTEEVHHTKQQKYVWNKSVLLNDVKGVDNGIDDDV